MPWRRLCLTTLLHSETRRPYHHRYRVDVCISSRSPIYKCRTLPRLRLSIPATYLIQYLAHTSLWSSAEECGQRIESTVQLKKKRSPCLSVGSSATKLSKKRRLFALLRKGGSAECRQTSHTFAESSVKVCSWGGVAQDRTPLTLRA